ncbi:hypothetical protein DPMN_116105 [Dreissena polymorpha]|uniref:Uncharacterized protein n=1 Tax=Dreissena polymorpha TaxID=45954 RepID=A0A9D4KP60_DREPO|nr:hypothetical protein DPMN_116105 [Dreissena polymorpha]
MIVIVASGPYYTELLSIVLRIYFRFSRSSQRLFTRRKFNKGICTKSLPREHAQVGLQRNSHFLMGYVLAYHSIGCPTRAVNGNSLLTASASVQCLVDA